MRIFVCFASEQRSDAELIAVSLRNRGHTVFFSRDTLPAGESYDERIEKAVQEADLLVFLVSPESVAKGNYTLTELSYARRKWPRPGGRVLPVMVSDVDLERVPPYLRGVGILQPEGNVAAETAAEVARMIRRSRPQQILLFGGGGVLTGIASYLVMKYAPEAFRLALVGPDGVTPLPGIIFGLLLAFCNFRLGLREWFPLLGIVVFTTVAWLIAHGVAQRTYQYLESFERKTTSSEYREVSPNAPESSETSEQNSPFERSGKEYLPFRLAAAGMVAGLVGGFGTVVGIAFVNARFRRLEKLLPILLAATVLGAWLELASWRAGDLGMFLLFVSWQGAVALLTARALMAEEREGDRFELGGIREW